MIIEWWKKLKLTCSRTSCFVPQHFKTISFEYRTDLPLTNNMYEPHDLAIYRLCQFIIKKYIPIQCSCVMHGLTGPENQHGIKFAERRAGYGNTRVLHGCNLCPTILIPGRRINRWTCRFRWFLFFVLVNLRINVWKLLPILTLQYSRHILHSGTSKTSHERCFC